MLPKNREYYIACSGGVDSMSSLNFLLKGKRTPYAILYYNHNTGSYANEAEILLRHKSKELDCLFITDCLKEDLPSSISKQHFWREKRYSFFDSVIKQKKLPIITAHTLDDCVEQYIISCFFRPNCLPIIPYNGPSNTIRPFRSWKKTDIRDYALKNSVSFLEDPSNFKNDYLRNKVRNKLVPILKDMDSNVYNHVRKLILSEK